MFKKLLQLKTLLVALLVMTGAGNVWAETVTDVLRASDFTATGTAYESFSNVSKTSGAVYAGQSAKDTSGNIQLRSKNSNSGIVSTTSGGKVKSVKITIGSGSNTIDVYGYNTAFTSASDLYKTGGTMSATKVGSLTKTGTITFNDDYEYVGIRSYSGAVYISSIEIVWEVAGGSSYPLTSISLSGDFPTAFYKDDTFSHEGMTVTATYEDTSTKDVTASATFEGYDMATLGQQTVTVSYTEGEVTKTASYGITVTAVPTHNVTWSVNGKTTVESCKEGVSISFPEDPADIKGKTFVGWVTDAIAGTTDTAPSFVTSATMGKSDVTYYAVFADEIPGTISNESMTIDANTTNVPTTYGNANTFSDYSLNGVQFKIQQMYKNGEKLQWRASGNNSGTGTMYNEDNLQSIQSIVLSYDSEDNNKNFTVNVGDTENPTSGTSITPSISNSTYTFNCSPYNKGYFVLTNGLGAGYLTSIVINYRVNSPSTYSAYCTAVLDAPTASVAACVFDTPFEVTITSETGTTLKYTTDGTDPAQGTAVDANSVVLSIPATTTRVRAIALLNGASSPELDVTYTYNPKEAPTLTVPASVDLKVNETGKTITVTTNSDGAVTFESSDDNHLLVDNATDNKVGELRADAEGTYTVTVTVEETENYRSAKADVTVKVTKTATTLTIDATGLTNTDVYVSKSAGSLAATVLDEDAAAVAGATVTWTSSDIKVATIDDNGTVTLVAEGTTTLTATYAGDETYAGSYNTYELTVTDSNPIRSATFTFNGQYKDEHITNGITNSKVHFICGGDADRFAISPATKYKDQLAIYRKTENTTNAGCFTISSTDDNYAIVRIELDGTNTGSLSTDVSSYDNSIWQGNSSSVTFTNNTTGTQCYISDITVLYARVTPLSVSSAGYATFSSTSALDFTKVEDIYAYTATVIGNAINFQRVYKVPANTGLLLRSVNGGAVSTRVPLFDGTADDVTDNAFVAATEEIDHLPTTDGGFTNYILNKPSGGSIGFYQANGQKVGAGKAYLRVSSKQATTRAFIAFSFDDPETGVAQVETLPQQGVAYDLQGRRVNAPKGGLYIINGKKVIVK